MKIAVLYDVWEEEGAVPEPPEPKPPARKKKSRKKAKREKEDREEIFEALEKLAICDQLRIGRANQRVEFVDAKQSVFVGGVAMEEFVLHQAGQLAKLGNIAAEKIDAMHQAQRPPDLALSRQHRHENLARRLGILICARDLLEGAGQQIF